MRGQGSYGKRRILCVFPRYTPSFGTFEYSYPLIPGVQAFMPPQGLLVIAAYLPADWDVRFIDENIRYATEADFKWAEAVLVSGMHIQRQQMNDICRRAHAFNLTVAIGGPSVSACPQYYPTFDYLHVGELGDATDDLISRLAQDPSRPPEQVVLKTSDRLEMTKFPAPAYELAEIPKYFLCSIQYSSGCPYQCEFCDIPGLYGRNPRLKSPQQILAELDKLRECGMTTSAYFVDDNFIGNRKAALDLLPHLIAWQKKHGYPIRFSCEATLNIAKRPEILEQMREAFFQTIFCGIETPDPNALKAMQKDHNMMVPIMEAIQTINGYGMEVVSGIIMGLDTDTPETADFILEFVRTSNIPLLTINLIQALPGTPLFDRLQREGRLVDDDGRGSNVLFKMPYDQVIESWKRCMKAAFEPDKLFERYRYQAENVFPKRLHPPLSRAQLNWPVIKGAFQMLGRIVWRLGVVGDYRRVFWKYALPRLAKLDIEGVIAAALVGHHLIMYARDASGGAALASNYSAALREASVPAE